jgi:hypothetical protein
MYYQHSLYYRADMGGYFEKRAYRDSFNRTTTDLTLSKIDRLEVMTTRFQDYAVEVSGLLSTHFGEEYISSKSASTYHLINRSIPWLRRPTKLYNHSQANGS